MSNNQPVGLFDPMLYQSSYANLNPTPVITLNFWKKFSLLNFLFNIGIPIMVIIFVAFVLKARYLSKLDQIKPKINTSL